MFRIDRTRVTISNDSVRANLGPLDARKAPSGGTGESAHALTGKELEKQNESIKNEIIQKADAKARDIRRQAEKLLKQAERDASGISEEARESGYNEGRKQAQGEYIKLVEENNQALERLISEIAAAREKMLADMEGEIIELCFEIVRKIANMDRTKDGELYKAIIKKALGQSELDGKLVIRLSAEDCERFFPQGEAAFDFGDSQVTAVILADPKLDGGEIMIETETETVTAGIQTQMKSIEMAFRQQLGK